MNILYIERNILSGGIREELATIRKASVFVASCEGIIGILGLGTVIANVGSGGSHEITAFAAIQTAALLSDSLYTAISLGERPFHLAQTIVEKIRSSTTPLGHWKASDIEIMLKGGAKAIGKGYSELEKGIAKEGDEFYIDSRCVGVTERATVREVGNANFTYQFDWGGIGTHLYGVNDGGILRKLLPNGKPEFYRESGFLVHF